MADSNEAHETLVSLSLSLSIYFPLIVLGIKTKQRYSVSLSEVLGSIA